MPGALGVGHRASHDALEHERRDAVGLRAAGCDLSRARVRSSKSASPVWCCLHVEHRLHRSPVLDAAQRTRQRACTCDVPPRQPQPVPIVSPAS